IHRVQAAEYDPHVVALNVLLLIPAADAQFCSSGIHCAPVLRIHSTASSTQRVGLRPGRPSPIFSSGKMIPDAFPLLTAIRLTITSRNGARPRGRLRRAQQPEMPMVGFLSVDSSCAIR